LALLTVLAIGALTSELDWLRIVAAMLFVLNAGRLLSPGWRHWVHTGEQLPATIDDKYTQPGEYAVEIVDVGDREISVIKALREVRGLTLLEAKNLVDEPATVAVGLSASSAAAVAGRIAAEGADARVTDPRDASG
jgi:ribosomal protein L7/L12